MPSIYYIWYNKIEGCTIYDINKKFDKEIRALRPYFFMEENMNKTNFQRKVKKLKALQRKVNALESSPEYLNRKNEIAQIKAEMENIKKEIIPYILSTYKAKTNKGCTTIYFLQINKTEQIKLEEKLRKHKSYQKMISELTKLPKSIQEEIKLKDIIEKHSNKKKIYEVTIEKVK